MLSTSENGKACSKKQNQFNTCGIDPKLICIGDLQSEAPLSYREQDTSALSDAGSDGTIGRRMMLVMWLESECTSQDMCESPNNAMDRMAMAKSWL
nr:hypothetical protein CFP56_04454 [Quercus suber]